MCFCCCCVFPFPCVCLDKMECNLFNSNLKLIHLIYIGASVFLFIFLISTMSIISWGRLSAVNLTFFIFLFLILVACMVLSIIIIYWKSDEGRQKEMQEKIQLLARICLILSIISIILFLIEIIIISVGFSNIKKSYPSCFGNSTTSVSVKVYGGIFIFKHSNKNFTSNSTISDFVENKNESNTRILSSKKEEEEEYICYEEFLTSAVYGMTYFTFIVSEIVNIAAICFFNELGKSNDSYTFSGNHQSVNQNNKNTQHNQKTNAPPIINIQTPQVIIVNQANNNNDGSRAFVNNSHQERGGIKLDKIDKSKNANNLNQNKNSNYNINRNNLQPKNIDYPEKEEALNNNIRATNGENQEIRVRYQNNINNQTIDSREDNNIVFGSDRIVLK